MTVDKEMEKNIIKMIRVKKYTHEPEILAALDHVATTQEELNELLYQEISPIYLCGENFVIPEHKQYLQFIAINEPVVEYISTLNYDDMFVMPYQPSPLHKTFAEELDGKGNEGLYKVMVAGIQSFTFDKRKSTQELYSVIINSDLPILR